MFIKFKPVSEFIGWDKSPPFIKNLIVTNKVKSILEIGAGANPTIDLDFIKGNNLDYTVNDVEEDELDKAHGVYKKLVLNLSAQDAAKNINNKYDFIFSRMVGEHIENGLAFHKNIFHLLNYNGKSFHCFSTLFSLPFIVNRILPDSLSNILLKKVASRDSYQHGKFKAYYSWCRGPSKNMIKRFEGIGFEIVEYVGYFGHNYYNKIALLRFLENIKSRLLLNKPVPNLTSYAHLILRKLPK